MTSGELFKVSRRDEAPIKALAGVEDPAKDMADVLATKLSFNDGITCESTIEEGYYLTNAFPTSLSQRDRRICPVCGSRAASAKEADATYTFVVRTCDHCVRNVRGCIAEIKGNKRGRRSHGQAKADTCDEQ